jgi:hypothetical protein
MLSGHGYYAKSVNGQNISYAVFDISDFDSPYFRITIMQNDGRKAWSNPYWFDALR